MNSDQPLTIGVIDDKLVISIGLNILSHVAENCPLLREVEGEVKVEDLQSLAGDVIMALEDEQEDGTTPVHLLLDAAILAAYENGSLGFAGQD